MAEEGDHRARLVLNPQGESGLLFSVVQVGINAVAILGGVVGEAVFTDVFAAVFAYVAAGGPHARLLLLLVPARHDSLRDVRGPHSGSASP